MRSYLQHARRHGPEGSDPIPGLYVPTASIRTADAGVTVANDNAVHYISIQDGVSSAAFSTTDSEVFSNGSSTAFTGSAVYGIQIAVAGTYAVLTNSFVISGGTTGHDLIAYWAASDGSAPSSFQQGRTQADVLDRWDKGAAGVGVHLFTTELMTVSDAQVPAVLCRTGTLNGGTDAVVAFQMVVSKLSGAVLSSI